MFLQRLSRGVLTSVAFLLLSPGVSHTTSPELNPQNSVAGPASLELLGTFTGGSACSDVDSLPPVLNVWIRYYSYIFGDALFKGVFLDTTQIDTVLTASDPTDPVYANIVERLTNGVWENIVIGSSKVLGLCGSTTRSEYIAFNLGVVDFYGATIDSISLTLDDLRFEYTQGTRISWTATMKVYGDWNIPVKTTTWGRIKALYR
jgi:hypothetical protein